MHRLSRKLILPAFIAVIAAFTACKQNNNDQSKEGLSTDLVNDEKLSKIKFDDTLHDFGKIQEGEVVTYSFEFTNVGDAPLVIDNASASCGCTVPEKPDEPIAPGQKGKLLVKFNSQGKSGVVTKEVYVTANTKPNMNKLYIKAEIENNQ